ncbi:MAG: exo-alpha-sialidase [Deltaproteobacteria bacterium]|nr:exo-alpha-sialidase [Deltaproteobacteria bacterium]
MRFRNPFAPFVNIRPDASSAEENRAWQGVPSIARTRGGRLYLAFMSGGIYEPDPRNCGIIQYSDDGGDTWSAPVAVLESKPADLIRVSDPEFWVDPDGALWLFWGEDPYEAGLSLPTYEQVIDMENDSEYHRLEAQNRVWCSVCRNPDDEETVWSEPRELFPGLMRNRPYVTPTGRWLFPAWLTPYRREFIVYRSDDKGQTLTPSVGYERGPGRSFDEPCFWRMGDGRIGMVVRTTPPLWKLLTSSDDGASWTDAEPFLECASQRPCIGNLSDGTVVMIPSVSPKSRNGLRLMISDNGGKTWDRTVILDDRERVSYPEFTEGPDGTLYVVYDRERNNKIRKSRVTGYSEAAKEILFARVPREALRTGVVTPDTVRARVISKARICALVNRFTAPSADRPR